jgi:predicted transglutaminase-like cysteine proteinase
MVAWPAGFISCVKAGRGAAIFGFAGLVLLASAPDARAGMRTGGLTSQPIGHYEFCKRHVAECNVRTSAAKPLRMTGKLWKQIVMVNRTVNKSIRPMNDYDIHGQDEVWSFPEGVGDCEDYVLEKRRQLHARGISLANLLITVVRKPDGEGHAVLTLRTDKGDYILDNLSDEIRHWSETDYRYLKRQAENHTGRWVTILGGSEMMVGALQ